MKATMPPPLVKIGQGNDGRRNCGSCFWIRKCTLKLWVKFQRLSSVHVDFHCRQSGIL